MAQQQEIEEIVIYLRFLVCLQKLCHQFEQAWEVKKLHKLKFFHNN